MRNVLLMLGILLTTVAMAQNQPKKPVQQPVQQPTQAQTVQPEQQINPIVGLFVRKSMLANRWNDAEQLKNSWYDLLALNPANDSILYLLAVHYYETRQYVSSVLVAKDLLSNNPKNEDILQLSASSYESLGLKDKALTDYESIYLLNNNTAILYKMATLQFDTKKYAECKINVDILLGKKDLDSLKVTIGSEAKAKEYPIKAAILNMKGLLALQDKDKVAAKKAFEESLVAASDFPLAKENLAKLK